MNQFMRSVWVMTIGLLLIIPAVLLAFFQSIFTFVGIFFGLAYMLWATVIASKEAKE